MSTIADLLRDQMLLAPARALAGPKDFATVGAPLSARIRAARPMPPSIGVGLLRASPSTSSVAPVALANSRPSKADWLNPRRQSRQRWSGTGTITQSAFTMLSLCAISRASSGASAILRPCLNPSTRRREPSV